MQRTRNERLPYVTAPMKPPGRMTSHTLTSGKALLYVLYYFALQAQQKGEYIFTTERNDSGGERSEPHRECHFTTERSDSAERSEAHRERPRPLIYSLAVAEGEPLEETRCERSEHPLCEAQARRSRAVKIHLDGDYLLSRQYKEKEETT